MMIAAPAVPPETLLGVTLALLAMAAHGTSMVVASFAMRHLSSAPGSMLAAAAGLPAGLLAGAGQLAFGSGVELPSLRAVLGFILAGVFSPYLVSGWVSHLEFER